jgi:hypothetical protein
MKTLTQRREKTNNILSPNRTLAPKPHLITSYTGTYNSRFLTNFAKYIRPINFVNPKRLINVGSFNILLAAVTCPNCQQKSQAQIQFKFGDTWQFKYNIGDTITWGGNQIGNPDLRKVKAYGIIESTVCPLCNRNSLPEEYDIFITDSVVKSVSPIEHMQDYLIGDGEYVVID